MTYEHAILSQRSLSSAAQVKIQKRKEKRFRSYYNSVNSMPPLRGAKALAVQQRKLHALRQFVRTMPRRQFQFVEARATFGERGTRREACRAHGRKLGHS